MDPILKESIWKQFGAAMDMLGNALRACPDELWQARLYAEPAGPGFAEFWYIGYHALFWLDFYLSETADGFAPPAPFTLSEFDEAGLPPRVYTPAELQTYLDFCRDKCRMKLDALTGTALSELTLIRSDWNWMTEAGLLLYNMRHVQEHAAQLSLFLGQQTGSAPGWVGRTRA